MLDDDLQMIYATRGISLKEILHINEVAFLLSDALLLIPLFRKASIPVLGSHVYIQVGSEIQPAYAMWHCNQLLNEDYASYVARSLDHTEAYIKKYPVNRNELFVFGYEK